MFAVFSLLVVLILSMTVVRVASVALSLTGVSRELARFQARSAFTGAGFTTSEAEKVVHHPVRRRIIMLLMLLGNAGIITAMSSLVLSFVTATPDDTITGRLWFRMMLLVVGLTGLWGLAQSRWLDRRMMRWVAWALQRWTKLEVRDYAALLHLGKGYAVTEFAVNRQDWVSGRALKDLRLSDEGMLVLGIEKPDGTYFGAPRGHTRLEAGDTAFFYGRLDAIAELDERLANEEGNWKHHKGVDAQIKIEADEERLETEVRRTP